MSEMITYDIAITLPKDRLSEAVLVAKEQTYAVWAAYSFSESDVPEQDLATYLSATFGTSGGVTVTDDTDESYYFIEGHTGDFPTYQVDTLIEGLARLGAVGTVDGENSVGDRWRHRLKDGKVDVYEGITSYEGDPGD